MRLLLDTHALLWWLAGSSRLPTRARSMIGRSTNEVYVSAASAWEISTKHRLGSLPSIGRLADDFTGVIAEQGFSGFDITISQAQRAGSLAGVHRDPFDRMLIAQALAEDFTIVSNESVFDEFGVRRIW